MTQEEFIKILDKKRYSYKIVGGKIVVDPRGTVYLESLEEIPPGVEFKNGGFVNLDSLKALPPGVEFTNEGDVYLDSLKALPPGVKFENTGNVHLDSLNAIPPGVKFDNGGDVWLGSLTGNWFHNWKGRIKGINSNRILSKMIADGVFDRR